MGEAERKPTAEQQTQAQAAARTERAEAAPMSEAEQIARVAAEMRAQNKAEDASEAKKKPPSLKSIGASEFLALQLPPRTFLLEPVIASQSLNMVFAPRGVGKTNIALTMAGAVATGSQIFSRWTAPRPAKVLYLDGELPSPLLQERIRGIAATLEHPDLLDNLQLVTQDLQDIDLPNLATETGQAALAPLLAGVELLVIDNIATLMRTGKANDEDAWVPVQSWLLKLRKAGKSVILIHHANKNGGQRGTAAKEDILDNVIELKNPAGYTREQGCVVELCFTKARSLFGKDTQPFEATLTVDQAGRPCWLTRSVEDTQTQKILELAGLGMSEKDIAAELGISRSTVTRTKKKAREQKDRVEQSRFYRCSS